MDSQIHNFYSQIHNFTDMQTFPHFICSIKK